MTWANYEASKRLSLAAHEDKNGADPFYSLLMAAMREADSYNIERFEEHWPTILNEFRCRYHAPGGLLPRDGS